MIKLNGKLSLRKSTMLIISFFHIPLAIAPAYCLLASAFFHWGDIQFAPSYAVKFIAIIIPIASSYFAARYIKSLIFYLLFLVGCAGLVYLITLCPILTGLAVFICFLRCYARMQEDGRTIFDEPHLAACLAYVVTFISGGVANSPFIQLFSLILLVIYAALFFLYKGLKRVGSYVDVNKEMTNLPSGRIVKSGNILYLSLTALILTLILPSLISSYRFVPIDLNAFNVKSPPATAEIVENSEPQGNGFEGLMGFEEKPKPSPVANFLGNVFSALALLAAVFFILLAIYKAFRNFSKTQREKADVIEFIDNFDEAERLSTKLNRIRPLDFSINTLIRRRYIRAVRRAKKAAPQPWHSPQEIEREAKINNIKLHTLYEKARYSRDGCKKDEL